MERKKRYLLITSALPYANGELHLGHILEFIQTDIWVRYHKQLGNECIYVSGDDAHGTPIMLRALNDNVKPEMLIAKYFKSHKTDLDDFNINLDNYYTTHSSENKDLSSDVFNKLYQKGYIFSECIDQLYDPVKKFFLPDRYVKGKCPKCFALEQYGDMCEQCSFRYDSVDLINPISVISGCIPIKRRTKHYFFNLKYFSSFLRDWCKNNISQNQIVNKLNEWFACGLKNWDISRDGPYFGIKIPNENDKYFYVWLDAPIGYIASCKNLCSKLKSNYSVYWKKQSIYELYHFIGKDIMYFHALFWPALLKGCDIRLPTDIFVHGFLTINGKKMSKSRGVFITAREYLDYFDPDYLRYYFASKLSDGINDVDLNLHEFVNKINSDLIGKLVNILSRCMKIIDKFDNILSYKMADIIVFNSFLKKQDIIIALYEQRKYSKVVVEIMKQADDVNLYIDNEKPWYLIKDVRTLDYAHNVCTTAINLFILLIINIKPILPDLSRRVEEMLNVNFLTWDNHKSPILGKKVKKFKHIMKRLHLSDIEKINSKY